MANADRAFSFRFVKSAHGDCAAPGKSGLLAASTTVGRGDPIRLGTDGLLVAATGSQAVLGFMMEDKVSGAGENPRVLYHLAREGDEWAAQWESGTTVAQANIGDTVGFAGSTPGALEVAATTSGPLAVSELFDDPYNEFGEHAIVVCAVMNAQKYDAAG